MEPTLIDNRAPCTEIVRVYWYSRLSPFSPLALPFSFNSSTHITDVTDLSILSTVTDCSSPQMGFNIFVCHRTNRFTCDFEDSIRSTIIVRNIECIRIFNSDYPDHQSCYCVNILVVHCWRHDVWRIDLIRCIGLTWSLPSFLLTLHCLPYWNVS